MDQAVWQNAGFPIHFNAATPFWLHLKVDTVGMERLTYCGRVITADQRQSNRSVAGHDI